MKFKYIKNILIATSLKQIIIGDNQHNLGKLSNFDSSQFS